jgi:MFS family permease
LPQIKQTAQHTSDRAAHPSSTIYYGWIIVAVCFVVLTLTSLVATSFPIFYVPVLENFKWSRGSTAIALSIHLILSGVSAPFAGGLIDKFGPRLIMPLGALVSGGALVLLSRSTALWQFYVTFGLIAAIGISTLHITPLTAVTSNWFVRNRGTAISIVVAGPGAGQLFILPLLQDLIERIGWRSTYLVFGLAILIVPTALVLLFLYTRPSDRGLTAEQEIGPERESTAVVSLVEDGQVMEPEARSNRRTEVLILNKKWAETDWTVGKAIRTHRFWALALVLAMVAVGFFLISVHLVAYLVDKGYSPLMAASVMGFQGLINIIGTLLGGMLADRIGRERTLTLGVLMFIACIVLLNIGGLIVSPVFIYGFAVLYGIGYGMAFPALMASVADLFQGKHFGSILGVILLSGYFGGALGSWLGGFFFDLTHAYRVNFLVAGIVMLSSAALIWKAGPGQIRLVTTLRAKQ